jgi:hypothetical protein
MLKIKWQGNFYEVPEDELSFYPGYEMASNEEFNNVGKLNDPVEETVIAGSENQTVYTDSNLDPGSLELEKINNIRKKFGNKDENVVSELNEEDEKKLREHIGLNEEDEKNLESILILHQEMILIMMK